MTQGIFTHEAGYNNGAAAARVASKRGLAAACVCSCLLKSTSVFTLTDCRAGDERGGKYEEKKMKIFLLPPNCVFPTQCQLNRPLLTSYSDSLSLSLLVYPTPVLWSDDLQRLWCFPSFSSYSPSPPFLGHLRKNCDHYSMMSHTSTI